MAAVPHLDLGLVGSASDKRTIAYATPYDVGWGNIVNFDHDFPGKHALQRLAANPPRTAVTLEWNPDDVGAAFTAQLRGTGSSAADPIESSGFTLADFAGLSMRIDYVEVGGQRVGVTSGRTIDYLSNRMVSLAFLDAAYAEQGREVIVVWGHAEESRREIRATIAPLPYFRGELRNETFDTADVPRR